MKLLGKEKGSNKIVTTSVYATPKQIDMIKEVIGF